MGNHRCLRSATWLNGEPCTGRSSLFRLLLLTGSGSHDDDRCPLWLFPNQTNLYESAIIINCSCIGSSVPIGRRRAFRIKNKKDATLIIDQSYVFYASTNILLVDVTNIVIAPGTGALYLFFWNVLWIIMAESASDSANLNFSIINYFIIISFSLRVVNCLTKMDF